MLGSRCCHRVTPFWVTQITASNLFVPQAIFMQSGRFIAFFTESYRHIKSLEALIALIKEKIVVWKAKKCQKFYVDPFIRLCEGGIMEKHLQDIYRLLAALYRHPHVTDVSVSCLKIQDIVNLNKHLILIKSAPWFRRNRDNSLSTALACWRHVPSRTHNKVECGLFVVLRIEIPVIRLLCQSGSFQRLNAFFAV